MENIKTPYGELVGVIQAEYYKEGALKECMMEEESIVETSVGTLIPKYDYGDFRSKFRNALSFYPSGKIKGIYLQQRSNIPTPLGNMDVEMITFYEDGSLHRIFPLYGQVTGFWSEEEEMKSLEQKEQVIHGISFQSKISCYCFYPSGAVKSLSLFGNDLPQVTTPVGVIPLRIGLSFYENGAIESIEPKAEVAIQTVVGTILAFDNAPIGMHGDDNSVKFTKEGELLSLRTSMTGFVVTPSEGPETTILPKRRRSFMDLEKFEMVPVEVSFQKEKVQIQDSDGWVYEYQPEQVKSIFNTLYKPEAGCTDCASCQGGCA